MLLDIAKGSCCISNGFGAAAAAVSVPPCPYPALVSWICLLAESSSYRLSSNSLSNPPAYKYNKREQTNPCEFLEKKEMVSNLNRCCVRLNYKFGVRHGARNVVVVILRSDQC